jgi:hypothetical protein
MDFIFNIRELIKHTFIYAFFVGLWAVLIENDKHKLSGFLYGALPLGFIYLLFIDNFSNDRIKRIEFAHQTWIGGFFFIIFTYLVYFMLKNTTLNILVILLLSVILFYFSIYIFDYYTKHFKNTKVGIDDISITH